MTEGHSGREDLEERLGRDIAAYHESALLHAAVKLALPERMEAHAFTAETLAAELGLSAPHLHRLLRGLTSLGICAQCSDGSFALTPQGRCLLPGSPSRLREKVQIVVEQYWQPWASLPVTIETGTPAFAHVFGANVSDWRHDHGEQGALFDSYLAQETLAQGPALIAALDVSGVQAVADIGGGYGGLLVAILQAHPHLTGILFDRPHRVEAAMPFLLAQGIAERVRCIGGDPLTAIPVKADLYVLNGVLQQCDDAAARTLLSNCRKAMAKLASLAIIERLLPERAPDDPAAIMLDLHMMTITGGRVRSRGDLSKLISQAGLALAKATPTTSGPVVLEAVTA
jgi:AraC-like DNA-binding protein